MPADRQPVSTLLVTLTGRDRPGVTSAVFDALAAFPVEVLDVEQVVLRGRLVLGILVTAPRDDARVRHAVEKVARNLGMDVEIEDGAGDNRPRGTGRSHVTVLGQPLHPRAISAIAGRVSDTGANIDRIVRIARYPVVAIELDVSGVDPVQLRQALAVEAAAQQVDVAVQAAGLYRRAKRLVVLDVDSTLIQGEVIEMLAAHAGYLEEVARVTAAAMRGELDFAESLRQRVALLAGVPATALDEVRREVKLTPGARTLTRTLRRLGYQLGVVSGGFTQVVEPLAAELGIEFVAANELEVADGHLTGRVVGPIVDRPGKAESLRSFAGVAGVPLSQTVAIGDGANDLDMLAAAGLGVAFNAKPVVRAAADTAVTVPYLDAILYLLGITREEVEAADAEAAQNAADQNPLDQGWGDRN
ncbi:phosphoserine phosphatase SerB [Actinopolymorpha pittospori]|uniref:phosphoserine phosphatase n=1 Tax=Actinopolymorpha pittospori TaxID=648752 RepID=A0A927RFL2_9ACTN|nr:phosphoserine phosphatase [Actinopolymorpha pittospori]